MHHFSTIICFRFHYAAAVTHYVASSSEFEGHARVDWHSILKEHLSNQLLRACKYASVW